MSTQQLLTDAKNTVLALKKEEQRNINPYASFAHQMIGLIGDNKVKTKADVLAFTRASYSRPNLNRQWRLFGNVLEKQLPMNINQEDMLTFFGYLKRMLTIEGKKEFENKNKHSFEKKSYSPNNYRGNKK